MTNIDYFNHPALSASKIKLILKNPYYYFNDIQEPTSPNLEFGEKVHKLVLESDLSNTKENQKVIVLPDFGDLRLKKNKEAKEIFYSDHANDYIVTSEQFECAKAVLESPFNMFFNDSDSKHEHIEFGKIFDCDFKCKADCFIPKRDNINLCIDLKTCNDISERAFTNSVLSFGYHIQSYIYKQLLSCETFLFVCIDKNTKQVACYNLADDAWMNRASMDIQKALHILENKDIYNKPYKVFGIDDTNNPIYIKDLPPPSYL